MSNAYRSLRAWLSIFFYPHSYLFDGAAAAVTSSRRLPVWGGQQPPHRSFFCLEQVTCSDNSYVHTATSYTPSF